MLRSARPVVGMLYNFSPNLDVALKKVIPGIRLDVVYKGDLTKLSDDDVLKLQTAEILIVDVFAVNRLKLTQRLPRLQWMHSLWDDASLSEEDIEKLKDVEILVVAPPLVNKLGLVQKLPKLKWMFAFSAGVDQLTRNIDSSLPFPQYTLTRNGGFFGPQMGEYVLGYMISIERRFQEMWQNQQQKLWKRFQYRNLYDLSLGIIGFGDIGKEIARMAKTFGVTVWATVRTLPTADQQSPYVDHLRLFSAMSEMLAACDYICVVLPSTPSTDGLLDGGILSHCQHKKSVFINIGRGNCVKETSILQALNEGWLSHAVLDVVETEPLPPTSPLWTHPNVTITPHLSGSSTDEGTFAKEFAENYNRYIKGEPLTYVVDWQKGY